jgi:hypothetical protein
MTIRAIRRIGILLDIGYAMAALEIILCHLGMTVGTVHLPGSFTRAMPLGIDVCVAFNARNISVFGILYFLFMDGHRYLIPVNSFVHIILFVTFQTFAIRGPEDQAGSTYRMRPMTVCASRDCAWFCFPKFSSYYFCVDLFDPGMTLGTGRSDIAGRNSGICIRMGKDQMVSVAIITRGGDDQTLLKQAFSMDTLGIVAQDVPFGDVIHPRHRGSFPVTFSAQDRNIHLVSAGSDIGGG